jgi:hypothetical protein
MGLKEREAKGDARPRDTREARRSTSHACIGAKGYGLNEDQQKAIADLWAWQEKSLRSDVVLGGPLT